MSHDRYSNRSTAPVSTAASAVRLIYDSFLITAASAVRLIHCFPHHQPKADQPKGASPGYYSPCLAFRSKLDQQMAEFSAELYGQFTKADQLEATIKKNLEALGYGE